MAGRQIDQIKPELSLDVAKLRLVHFRRPTRRQVSLEKRIMLGTFEGKRKRRRHHMR